MTQLFAVLRAHGPAWKQSQPLEAQEGWLAHAGLHKSTHFA